ncbi:anti-phage deoxyguanosine triphosphatase [Rhizobium ecuadorense]|uniref:anti-phage deoxyguanosine triphosphatase n=1 Tax=Rhizobium ecuadorense TaxID=1671795 RepID=UPI0009E846BD|nr:anti-phage deoxyguanosine triphosphatase [Rhizobium ecuadorense]
MMYSAGDYERPVPTSDTENTEWRPPFIRDYGRIIHSASFRRQQGKTQVFPGHESDFFRNRLTHSLEVAQIAEGIADRLNVVYKEVLEKNPISSRLCAAAGLVHDIGHPPFGHNGERALDDKMKKYGGFEGNAQTLRILSRLDKKALYKDEVAGDNRAGMNLCYRTLAAILKYDRVIPLEREEGSKLTKGYYLSEKPIVDRIKEKVLRGKSGPPEGEFKTIECAIMDIADDIAYSVYDLEDSLKAGFLTPATILATDDKRLDDVAADVTNQMGRPVDRGEVMSVFVDLFKGMIPEVSEDHASAVVNFAKAVQGSHELSSNGYTRTKLSSQLVHEFINGVEFKFDPNRPALSKVWLKPEIKLKVEVLKQYTYKSIIYSPRVKLGEFRGTQLVKEIFEALAGDKGELLMPDDVRERFLVSEDKGHRARTICDFVAGMTDRYAMEFWARLKSDGAESMFKDI